ncbi:protein EXPRESSION OF TERPENOIDS 1-like [Salvia hispanica]|uniref:protein EXPRESSION OF TERPENOIDS 1-like n=1 Tax=Salvia hispanica TaxID=49212 RepID=UPI0020095CDE|nr:protein EXPRESSION OF TERPENOIDS 1-like [Salvia hispanica]
MSGFFSLEGGGKDHHQETENNDDHSSNNSLFLFRNQEIYNKGFELWQQYYQLHHQQRIKDAAGDESYYAAHHRSSSSAVMRRGGEGANCQDCGNQAKKDCVHLRCRTCCKSRGFDCQTHVKSTWVPAAKRRERQVALTAAADSNINNNNPKRIRESRAVVAPAVRLPTSGFEVGQFPAEVSSPAVFRCVRVSAVDEAEQHYAYQTALSIGGHVFKGILYDQGGESSSSASLDLIANASNSQMAVADPNVYPTPLNAFMAGTQFFPPPRP